MKLRLVNNKNTRRLVLGPASLNICINDVGGKKKKYKSKQISPSLNDWRLCQYQEDWSLTQKEMND